MQGNIPDLESMINKYGNDVLRLCFLYLKDVHLAEDALQETFFKVYKKYNTYQQLASERTWIIRIAINVCKNYLRTSWLKRVIPVNSIDDNLMNNSIGDIPGWGQNDSDLLEQIMNLNTKYKEVILLYYYQQFKISEIAGILHISESTVAVRLSRAREKLKDSMKGWSYHGELGQSE